MWAVRFGVLSLLIGYFLVKVESLTQEDIDNMAKNLHVRYKVIDNLSSPSTFTATILLTNKGTTTVKNGNWAIYFCSIRQVAKPTKNQSIRFEHINGCVHKFYPTAQFEEIKPSVTLSIDFIADHWEVARSDVMPNWYVTSPGLTAKTLESTTGEDLGFVGPFLTKEQWKRFKSDLFDPYSAWSRYDKIGIDSVEEKDFPIVIPRPISVEGLDRASKVTIDKEWKIYAPNALKKEAEFLANKFKASFVTSAPSDQTKVIHITLGDPDVKPNGVKTTSGEAYRLVIDSSGEKINLIGREISGVFYGIQSLLALADSKNTVPMVTIKDAPRYGYRGMHLDVGRNFMPKSAVLRLLDVMAMYKLNKFHFHLTDDEGWRLEIPGLSDLTTVGSKRCYDPSSDKCLQTDLGSGPDEPSGQEYYSVKDYKEILQYASDRHIQVIPEFDMPGHGYAAIKSMEARARRLNRTGSPGFDKYLLTEPGDPSQYLSIQMFKDDAINPCIESTYTFVEHIVNQVVSMHAGIQPLTIYHFGGDEVAHGAWKKSNACKTLAQQRGLNFSASDIVDKLKDYFVQRVANITVKHNLSLGGWEDGLLGKGDIPYDRRSIANKDAYAYAWNNIWEWGGGKRAYQLANAGYKVIMTQATHLYFDHPQEPDPEERGYYWATRFTNTRKTFGFIPDDLFNNVEETRAGGPLTRKELCAKEGMCVDLTQKQNIVGIAGALWTETVRTADQMDSMIYPRILALAERAWHKAPWEDLQDQNERNKQRTNDWTKFANALGYRELARLDKMGVKYYVPPPGARVNDHKLKVRTSFPGLTVQYSEDDGKIWRDVTSSTNFEKNMKLQTLSADRSRASRQVVMAAAATADATSINLTTGILQTIALIKVIYKYLPS